jgi:hypothetical protein
MPALFGVVLAVGVVETALGMSDAASGESLSYKLGYGIGGAIPSLLFVAVVALLVGLVIYVSYLFRSGRITFLRAIFNWPVVVVAALFALLQYI